MAGLLRLMRQALVETIPAPFGVDQESDALPALEFALGHRLTRGVCFFLDLSLLLDRDGRSLGSAGSALWGDLRALRDRHEFELTYGVATRHWLPDDNELAELLFGHTLWLGPLSQADASWNVARYSERTARPWDANVTEARMAASCGYPALLRGVCEACAAGNRGPVAERRRAGAAE
jgi:hypothetical protein